MFRTEREKLSLVGCLHDRANIEQLARRSMVISMLIRRAGGL